MVSLVHSPANVNQSERQDSGRTQDWHATDQMNVGSSERATSVATGALLTLAGLSRGTLPGMLIAGVGGALLYRGFTGRCPVYEKLGVDTQRSLGEQISERGIHVEQAYLINRTPQDLYTYWRDFTNLPRIMSHLESVQVIDERRSHWVAKAPRIAGGSVEWDAEITQDEPNSRIVWRSLPGSDIDTVGEIRFASAIGDRGTEVHVSMEYVPPAGRIGHWVATLFGLAPRRQMREDLRSFKRLMETGEIATVEGQPRGTCTGEGRHQTA